jgi:hypothetical protein
MTSLFAARRAAEEFADTVDRSVDGHGAATPRSGHHAELLQTVALLRQQTSVTPRAEFVADLRARLLAAADTVLEPAAARDRSADLVALPTRSASSRIGAAAAAALVVIGGTTGLAAAAQESVPGDTLYPVKRGIENAVSAFNTSDAGRGTDLLGEAGNRLEEAQALTDKDASAAAIADTLADFEDAANEGAELLFTSYRTDADGDDIATVRQFTAQSRGDLDALALTAPAGAQPSIDSARATLGDLDTQARTLCAACGDDFALAGLDSLPAAATFRTLITQPVREAGARDQALLAEQQQSALAEAAEQASHETPPSVAPGPQTGPPSGDQQGTAGPALPGVGTADVPVDSTALNAVTAPVKSTLTGTTAGVKGLISEVTGTTPLAPVTDPLADTLQDTVAGDTGLLP